MFKYSSRAWFVGGLLAGLLSYHAALWVSGYSVVEQESLQQQKDLVAKLQAENLELTEDLFKPRWLFESKMEGNPLPYDEFADARSEVASARNEALNDDRFLMVTFGANWCMDCRNLHRQLKSEEVEEYTAELFHFANVDVGKFNKNADLATELGVSLSRGIPVAIFFDPEGNVIGTTNEGQLEPARLYSSKQILRFVRDIAEQSRILPPDAVRR